MWRSRKLIIIVLLAMVVLAASISGVALAWAGTTSSNQPRTLLEVSGNTTQPKTLLARVAEILGIDQQKLEAAVTQAKSEMQLEALKNRLQALVNAGKITQVQADEYLKWWQSKPDMAPYQQQLREWQRARPAVPPELKDWQQARPNVPLPGRPGGRGFRGMRGFPVPHLPTQ